MKHFVSLTLIVGALLMPTVARAQQRPDTTYNFGLKQFAVSAGVLSVVVLAADAPIAKSLHGDASSGTLNTARQFARMGEATGLVPVIGSVAIVGLITRNRKVERTALHAAEGVVLASITVQVGKSIMGRERPVTDPDLDGMDFLHYPSSRAFPSGHTAAAFALATSLGDAIDKPWARAGLYALAAGTGWARMAQEEHWLSDVLAGAAIGIVSAKFVSGRVRVFGVRAPDIIVGPRSAGLHWSF